MSWIDQLIRHLEQVTCSGCGEYYHGGDIAAVVTEPSRLIVRLRCRSCSQDGIAILDFGTTPVEVAPITADEVLDCHDLLARAARPPTELFPSLAAGAHPRDYRLALSTGQHPDERLDCPKPLTSLRTHDKNSRRSLGRLVCRQSSATNAGTSIICGAARDMAAVVW